MVPDILRGKLVECLHPLPVLQPDGETQQPVQDLGAASVLTYRAGQVSEVSGVDFLPVFTPGVSQSLSSIYRIMSGKQKYRGHLYGNLEFYLIFVSSSQETRDLNICSLLTSNLSTAGWSRASSFRLNDMICSSLSLFVSVI